MSLIVGSNATPNSTGATSGIAYGGRFQAVADGTGITDFYIYALASGNVKIAVYADNAEAIGSRLAYNNTGQAVTLNQWNKLSVSSLNITNGSYYWLLAVADTNGALGRTDTGGTSKYNSETYSTWTWSDPIGFSGTNISRLFAFYLDAISGGTIDLSGTLSSTSNSASSLVKQRGYSSTLNSTLRILSSLVKTRGLNGTLPTTSNLICTLITEAIIELIALLPSVSGISAQAARLRAITATLQNTSNIIDTLARSRSISAIVNNTVNIIATLLTDLFVELNAVVPSESNINTALQRLLVLLAILNSKVNISATLSTPGAITAETQNIYGFINVETIEGEINITDTIQGFVNSEYYRGDIYAS
jgi:hypothetical protein